MQQKTEEQKENLRTWIKALRSGEYIQGSGFLRSVDNKFCCWGVACDLADKSNWTNLGAINQTFNFYCFKFESEIDPSQGTPTGSFALDRFGIDRLGIGKLIAMNDGDYTFLEIADYIEQNYLKDI